MNGKSNALRVFIDSNILVSAVLSNLSQSSKLLKLLIETDLLLTFFPRKLYHPTARVGARRKVLLRRSPSMTQRSGFFFMLFSINSLLMKN